MKSHWMNTHPMKFGEIKSWLGESDARIRSAEALAREGMRGPGGSGEGPVGQFADTPELQVAPQAGGGGTAIEKYFDMLLASEGMEKVI
jgi:hypothetical protein